MSLTGRLAHSRLLRNPWKRRLVVAMLAVIFGLLAFFPERYRAVISLTPTDPASLGLSGALGQLGAVNSVYGDQAAVEVSLKVAQNPYVRTAVMRRLDLPKRLGFTPLHTSRWLERNVDVRVMRGGLVQIETTLSDPQLGKDIVTSYGDSLRAVLARVARTQTEYKRRILLDLVGQSGARLANARSAYNTFRLRTHYSEPRGAIAAIGDRVPQLQGQIKSKERDLAAASRFATPENFVIQRMQAELTALREQLAATKSVSGSRSETVGEAVKESTELDRLKREFDIAQGLYDSYTRYLEGTSVEDLASTASVRVLEPAYIDTTRQFSVPFLIMAVLTLLGGLVIEAYIVRPPLGDPEPA